MCVCVCVGGGGGGVAGEMVVNHQVTEQIFQKSLAPKVRTHWTSSPMDPLLKIRTGW